MIPYEDARRIVMDTVTARPAQPRTARVAIHEALGRVLAEDVFSDRDYPPFDRSTRDGYAVRSADLTNLPRVLEVMDEIKAGSVFTGNVLPGVCVQIMTGAAVPPGCDAVVMLEHVERSGTQVKFTRPLEPGQNVVPRGSESKAGERMLPAWTRLGYAEIAVLGQVGCTEFDVACPPRVAILSTGDEVVEMNQTPGPFQIRNSNTGSLAAQVELAGGEPVPLPNAPDEPQRLRELIERGLQEDALVLSGGVSAGKYDLVETVLRELGAEFFFDAVAIRPGKPAVFGWCRGKPVFGLPGNPVSTMVTFELFVVPALDLLSGAAPRPLPLLRARIAHDLSEKPGFTHFVPGNLYWAGGEPVVAQLPWQGSGDIATLRKGNCFVVTPASRLTAAAGDWVDVLPRRGLL